MTYLKLENVSKRFVAHGTPALDGVSLAAQAGECLALLGPSGCGKTTLLRLIAGLEQPSGGAIHIGDTLVTDVPCHQRGVAMLFQRPALIPNETVRQNLQADWSLGRLFGRAAPELARDIIDVARILGLDNDLDRAVGQLSGGQQQRTALGRCLLRQAKVWLLDEPLGHLDAPLRTELRRQIRLLARERGATVLLVTHDPSEAFAFGDRVAVMHQGQIVQVDVPEQLLRRPLHLCVAEMALHERGGLNFLPGEVARQGERWHVAGQLGEWQIPENTYMDSFANVNFSRWLKKTAANDGKLHIIIGVAVDDLVCANSRLEMRDETVQIQVEVEQQEFAPHGDYVIGRDSHGRRMVGRAKDHQRFSAGQEITMTVSTRQTFAFEQATGATLWVPAG